ncbi:MAG TPA: hypothetical protein VF800_05495 [Telluria sp.]
MKNVELLFDALGLYLFQSVQPTSDMLDEDAVRHLPRQARLMMTGMMHWFVAALMEAVMPISLDHPVPLDSATPPPFIFFATEAHSFWRYFWPFLSVRQFIFTLAVCTVGVVVTVLLARRGGHSADFTFGMSGGFVLSVIRLFPYEELPGKITVATTRGPVRQLMPMMEQIILELGFTPGLSPSSADRLRFRSKTEARLGRGFAPAQNIELCIADENIIELLGPKSTLDLMAMRLRRKLEA